MKRLMLALAITLVAATAMAGDPPKPPMKDTLAEDAAKAMAALPQMSGSWEGSGWIRMGPGEPIKFVGEETVESRLDGRVMVVEGRHWDSAKTRIVHHAFGMLFYDAEAKGYRFRTHLANGRGGEFPARVEDGAWIWEMTSPNGAKTRYTIHIDKDQWKELGHREHNGQWVQFFEMELKRK